MGSRAYPGLGVFQGLASLLLRLLNHLVLFLHLLLELLPPLQVVLALIHLGLELVDLVLQNALISLSVNTPLFLYLSY